MKQMRINKFLGLLFPGTFLISCSSGEGTECIVSEQLYQKNGEFVADAIIYDLGDDTFTIDFVPLKSRDLLKHEIGFERFFVGFSPRPDQVDLARIGYEGRLLPNQIQPIVSLEKAIEVVRLEGSVDFACDESGMLWISNLDVVNLSKLQQQPIAVYREASRLSY